MPIEQPVEIVKIDSTAILDSIYEPVADKIDAYFSRLNRKTVFYGNVLFAQDGHPIIKKSYGYTNIKTKEPLTLDHSFQLASASKPFTAIATLILYERGLLNLTDTINKFFPDLPYEGITIHHLLTHQSGLSKYTHFCDNPADIWPDKSCSIYNNDVLKIISEINPPIVGYPGRKFYYSNTNYVLLASIIEKVSGLKFRDFLKQNIFEPCEMESTVLYYRDNEGELKNPVYGYESNFRKSIDIYLNGCVGDKGIYSTVDDLLKFDQALYNNTLLSDSVLQLAFTAYKPSRWSWKNQPYGYGFRMKEVKGLGKIIYHNGWWKGFRSYFIRLPEKKQTVIILTHIKRGSFLKAENLLKLMN